MMKSLINDETNKRKINVFCLLGILKSVIISNMTFATLKDTLVPVNIANTVISYVIGVTVVFMSHKAAVELSLQL